ncbi:ABC transporter permease [Desulfoscipio gibsoniae]|uniref:Putative ABC-type transport system, permease component n=1 Tax=Desulfoscipio gibsoniae DSM 7213 TaxID=767817 RepID=R4KLZ3_9FIRM|nr:ABC transporter permease [Desulfoscipio gibsoniae]AGL01535.1 putative ABC-type transport system, permease component [Desulfoscipio gibsoniae DSM 7213]
MSQEIFIAILATAITAGTPILYAALGEVLAERSGILNLGVEGMMLVGAVSGFICALKTANPWYGLMMAMLAGGLLALVHAFLTVTLRANQVVSGLALTMFGTGLSGYLGQSYVGVPLPVPFKTVPIPVLSDIPVIGPVFFNHDPVIYLSYLLVPALWFCIFRTRAGLHLRAVGENPAAADSMGINVFQTRYLYVIIGGMLAGIGGAYLSLHYVPSWMENMTAGRGWIAVALVIFATWNPVNALWGSYLFGGIDALGFRLQTLNVTVSPYFLKMLPYIFTVLVLILVTKRNLAGRIGSPQALGLPYDREER